MKKIKLKSGEYLSDKFDKLPHGIINKSETGIGATTVELRAARNSIIVEPLKVTASSKAKLTLSTSLDVIYVGSATVNHPKSKSIADIEKFILAKTTNFKKIIVVSDSLHKVIEILKKHKIEDYFLTIDESDTMQTDAVYRESMEKCYELYKEFPKEQRCMLTATQIEFNDPDLKHEPITNIAYEKPIARDVVINYTDNILGATLEKIKEIHSKHPKDKIVVAYNNVVKLKDLAMDVERLPLLTSKDVCILCGASSKKTAQGYFRELESTKLPTLVNLKTSAYHTGFDLSERYHLITVVDNTDFINCLSESRIKQIAGRCRDTKGLLSENIIYNFKQIKSTFLKMKFEDLVEAANIEIRAIKCLTENFGKTPILREQILNVRSLVTDNVKYLGYSLLKMDEGGEPKISYLNIDAALETYRFYTDTYLKKRGLFEELKKSGNNVTELTSHTTTVVASKTDFALIKKERVQRINRNISTKSEHELTELMDVTKDKIEKICYQGYLAFAKHFEKKEWASEIINRADTTKSTRLESLFSSASFAVLEEKSNLKRAISSVFEIGKVYDDEEITKSMNFVLQKLGLATLAVDKNKALKLFDLFVENSRNTKHSPTTKKVKSYNATKVKIINYSEEKPNLKSLFRLDSFD